MARPANVQQLGYFEDQRADWKPLADVIGQENSPVLSKFVDGESPRNREYVWFAETIKQKGLDVPGAEGNDTVIDPANKTLPYKNYLQEWNRGRALTRMNMKTQNPGRTNTKEYQVSALMRLNWQSYEKLALDRQPSSVEALKVAESTDPGSRASSIQNYGGNVDAGSTVAGGGVYDRASGLTTAIAEKSSGTPPDFDLASLNNLLERIHNKGVLPKGYCLFTTTAMQLILARQATNAGKRQIMEVGKGKTTDFVEFYESEAGFMVEYVASPHMEQHVGNNSTMVSDLVIVDPMYIKNHWKDKMAVLDLPSNGPASRFSVYSAWTVSIENPDRHGVMRGRK